MELDYFESFRDCSVDEKSDDNYDYYYFDTGDNYNDLYPGDIIQPNEDECDPVKFSDSNEIILKAKHRKRQKTSCLISSDLLSKILNWRCNMFDLNEKTIQLTQIPESFRSLNHYYQSLRILLTAEAQTQISQTLSRRKNSVLNCTVIAIEISECDLKSTSTVVLQLFGRCCPAFNYGDVLQLSTTTDRKHFCLAIVTHQSGCSIPKGIRVCVSSSRWDELCGAGGPLGCAEGMQLQMRVLEANVTTALRADSCCARLPSPPCLPALLSRPRATHIKVHPRRRSRSLIFALLITPRYVVRE